MSRTPAVPKAPKFSRAATKYVNLATEIVIHDTDSLAVANDTILRLKDTAKAIEEFFQDSIKRAHDLHKALITQKRQYLDPVKEADKDLSAAVNAFIERQEEKNRELEARLHEEQATVLADAGFSADTLPAPVIPSVSLDGLGRSTYWKSEVLDFRSLVRAVADGTAPEDVLEVNMGALNRRATQYNGTKDIPGVRFFKIGSLRRTPGER